MKQMLKRMVRKVIGKPVTVPAPVAQPQPINTAYSINLNDYIIRGQNLYNRSMELQKRFGSFSDPNFEKYIDTEGILYIREIQESGVPFPPWQEMLTVGGETDLRLFLSIGHQCYGSVKNYIPYDLERP